ncbi:MAG: ARMT1-like domain-containing protein [Planctomycetota bacterium]
MTLPFPPTDTAVFPLLTDPDGYRACGWDLAADDDRRAYWLSLFRGHFPSLLDAYRKEADDRGEDAEAVERAVGDAADRFHAYLDRIEHDPASVERLDILTICTARENALRAAGIADAYRLAKQTDTEHALGLLPELLEELDALDEDARRVAVVEGVFAGNIYDLGATETVSMFTDQRVDFRAVRAKLKPRPWRFDGLDAWLSRLNGPAHRAAVLFVDNAGPDMTLGMLPLARELLRRGTAVILTANTHPSLNDVTHDELTDLVDRVAAFDPALAEAERSGRLTLVPSGNHAPLIDLTRLSPVLVEAVEAAGVDLVVLEGMGRAVETNLDARFTCDTLKLAMLKDRGVAEALDAELFDLVMKFEPADGQ